MLGWLFSKATGGIVEAVGTAVNKNIRTLKGDKAEVEAAIHDEQMAVLAEHAAEFVARPTRTKLDSFVDFLNRLPRVIITFWIFAIFTWPAIDPVSFSRYILSMDAIPDELWQLAMVVLSLYFGGRIIASDIRKPRLTEEQKREALRQIERREKAIIEARTPLIVERAPDRKPPPPPSWVPSPPREKQPDIPRDLAGNEAVDAMIESIIHREGGYVNHPADRGGPTNRGITQSTLEAWRECPVTVDDVRNLTKDDAAEIYRAQYYFAPGIDGLPAGIQAQVFDIAVNSGPRTSIKLLQRALNQLGAGIAEDGVIGPETREASAAYPVSAINGELVKVRLAFYDSLVENDPSQAAFIVGWRKRANSFLESAVA